MSEYLNTNINIPLDKIINSEYYNNNIIESSKINNDDLNNDTINANIISSINKDGNINYLCVTTNTSQPYFCLLKEEEIKEILNRKEG